MKLNKLLLLIIPALIFPFSEILNKEGGTPPPAITRQHTTSTLAVAIKNRAKKVWVKGEGEVVALLPDDTKGLRHQRILISVQGSEETVLIAHNIDIAPRLNHLQKGDHIYVAGEYIWNNKGGVLHWTHHDPKGDKAGGWILFQGKKYL